jgi:hypothetical protein
MGAEPRWGALFSRSRPLFGQVTLWCLLVCGWCLCGYFLAHWRTTPLGEPTGPASVLAFLPDAIRHSRLVFLGCGVLFYLASVFWLFQKLLPLSGWLTALAFTAVGALYMENASQATHVAHLTNWFLLLHALWYQVCHREIRTALAACRFWQTPLYPRWVHSLGVLYLGLFYGFSGLSKWRASGLGWPNGVSLQLWASLWGDPDSIWTRMILTNRGLAVALQTATILGETGGFVAIFSRRLRPLIGLALIGFHVGAICVFGWGFHANMLLLALFFLPFDRWIPFLFEWLDMRIFQSRER